MKPHRAQYERLVLRYALESRKPVLGVCGGMQLLAVELGGTLYQDLRDELPQAFDHEQKLDPRQPGHEAEVVPRSTLAFIVGEGRLPVNSTHHQAVKEPGRS